MTRKNLHSLLLSMTLLCLVYMPAYSEILYYDDMVYNGEEAIGNPMAKVLTPDL